MSESKLVPYVAPHLRDPQIQRELAKKAEGEELRKVENSARLALAKTKKAHAEMAKVGIDFVLGQIKKWATLSAEAEFANTVGPIEPAQVIKLAEFLSKNFRLDSGQATERIANEFKATLRFDKMTQQERDDWKALNDKYASVPDAEAVDEDEGDS